ncbi:putative inactive methylesterase 20 isoform X4 [Magnolia sinica]|uniref:putative inactive methylesterase 20 isoform X4 n=1 Tax=Magnolia sinica TaxID=86752 RepID=UPI002658C9F8|nr:putative inactive methylesterase 20 isoform X4 [Magnolia sinica]
MEVGKNKKHFVLVHGACHGAWCWYKVATLLTSAGNRVTAVDLAASGINPKKFEDEVLKFSEYSLPLLDIMASLPPQERVILVGHSLGGLNLALAMDKYPEKVSVAVFLTAFMPDSSNRPSYILDKYYEQPSSDLLMDCKLDLHKGQGKPATILFGPRFLSQRCYQLSPPEVNMVQLPQKNCCMHQSFRRRDTGLLPEFTSYATKINAFPLISNVG